MAAAVITGQHAQVDGLIRQFETLKAARTDFDVKWQKVSDYILPRRDFSIAQRPNQLRPSRVTSSVATNANSRMAALLLAYMVGARPFLLPNVKRGLAVAGKRGGLDPDGADYLDALRHQIFDHMMLPRAQLMLRLGSMLKEFCAFGCGVVWTGRRRGFGPYYNARPVQACWWSENEEGVIDTLFFRLLMPKWRVLQRWPQTASKVDGWTDDAGKCRDELELVPVVMACQPRPGGRAGAVAEAKPFAYVVYAEDKKAVLEESGYDSFPYAVFRYDPMPGAAYAEGPGCQVLPDVMVINRLQQAIENAADQKAQPAIAVPARMFGRKLDRRPGAINAYNPAMLGLTRADQAILKLDFTGDPTDAIALRKDLIEEVEIGYFTDWLRLRESGDMTAEEVSERRDMRLRGMASIVANCEQPMTVLGDRTMDVLDAEGLLLPGPRSIAGMPVDWEYGGPLAIAQLRGGVQATLQVLNARALVAKDDPGAAEAVDLEESLRAISEGLAAPEAILRTRADSAARAAAIAHQQQQEADVAKTAALAGAARDAGQGLGAVAPPEGGPLAAANAPPAPFAPAAPFAQAAA